MSRLRVPALALLLVALLIGAPSTAAAECRFVRTPVPQPWVPHPWFPGCFIVVVGWLICYTSGGVPTPDDPPETPTVTPIEHVVCYSGNG